MGLFEIELTQEDKQRRTKERFIGIVSNTFVALTAAYRNGLGLLDSNPYGLTREDVLAGLGDDAAELMRLAGILRTAVNDAVPGTIEVTE